MEYKITEMQLGVLIGLAYRKDREEYINELETYINSEKQKIL